MVGVYRDNFCDCVGDVVCAAYDFMRAGRGHPGADWLGPGRRVGR